MAAGRFQPGDHRALSRILFIGPDVTSVSAAATLRAAGYDVFIRPDCPAAQEFPSNRAPSLIIVSVTFPAKGLTSLREARGCFGNVPIVALVEGELTPENIELLVNCGATQTVVFSPFFPTLPGIVSMLIKPSSPS